MTAGGRWTFDDDDDFGDPDEFADDPVSPAQTARSRRTEQAKERVIALLSTLPESVRRTALTSRSAGNLYLRPAENGRGIVANSYANDGYVTLSLTLRDDGTLHPACSCRLAPHCVHIAGLLHQLIGNLAFGNRDLAGFVDAVVPATFEERLGELDAFLDPSATRTSAERLRLRVSLRGAAVVVEAVAQKPLKKGGFSVGRPVSPAAASRWSAGDEHERLLASTLADATSTPLPAVTTLLAVRDAPGLVIDGLGNTRLVVPVDLGFGLVRFESGYRAVPFFGDVGCTTGVAITAAGAVALPEQDGRVFVAHAPAELLRLVEHLLKEPLVAPPELAPLLVERFSRLEPAVKLALPPELAGREVEADDRVVFVMEPIPTGARITLRLRPLPGGPLVTAGEGPVELSRLIDGERRRVTRRVNEEPPRVSVVLAEIGLSAGDRGFLELSNDGVLDLLERLREPPLDAQTVLEWPKNHRPPSVVKAGALRVKVNALADWFGVEGGLEVSGEVLELATLLDAVREGRRFVQAGANQFVNIERLFRGRLAQLADVTRASKRGLELSRHAAAVSPDLFESDDNPDEHVITPMDWLDLADRARRARSLEPHLPSGLHADLREYQVDGYKWMRRLAELGTGAVLADDMGLGKTVQAIAMLVERAPLGPQLVVAPTSVGFNWARELARFAPGLRVVPYREGNRRAIVDGAAAGDVVIASYGLVRAEGSPLLSRRWTTLVLDEAHAIKTWASATAKAVRALEADWKVALTGTPVENHLGELWSLIQTVIPGLLGGWEEFSRSFATPIEKGRSEPRRKALARVLRPFILRRTKGEVLRELPARTEVRLDAVLSKTERALYESARLAAIDALAQGGEKGRFEMLAALTRLRQLASHARMVFPEAPPVSAKLAVLLDALEEAREEGHRSLVFSQFVTHLALIREALVARGFDPIQLDGSTPAADRGRLVDRFQKGDVPVMLVSLKAGGTGLNLTAADTVFLMDPWWNPAVEDQAADRAHRMGQTRPVTIVRIVATGTVEEKVLAMHERKRALVTGVLDGSDAAGKLSTGDLLALLNDTPAAFDEEPDADEPPNAPSFQPDPIASPPAAKASGAWQPTVDAFAKSLTNLAPASARSYASAVRGALAGAEGTARVPDLERAIERIVDPAAASAFARFLRYLYAAGQLDRAESDALEGRLGARRGAFSR